VVKDKYPDVDEKYFMDQLKGYDDIGITASSEAYFLSNGPPRVGGASSSTVGGLGLSFNMSFDNFMFEIPDVATVDLQVQEFQASTEAGLGMEEGESAAAERRREDEDEGGYKYPSWTTRRIP
ncbi:hypothetical protein Dimus_001816, partial [Dionaea muscipula]